MANINFSPFPGLTTERLILRQLEISDGNELMALRSNALVNRYINRPPTITIHDTLAFIEKINNGIRWNEWVYWAITPRHNNRLIGTVCYWNISEEKASAEVGYEIHPDFQGKGLMLEALSEVIAYGFDTMKLSTIEAYTNPENGQSVRLLERFNFRRAGSTGNGNQDADEVIYLLSGPAGYDNQ